MKKKQRQRESPSTQLVYQPRTAGSMVRRNALPEALEPVVVVQRGRRRVRERIKENLPPWQAMVASAVGGGGGAVLGSILSLNDWNPVYVGLGMTALGAAGAMLLPPGVGRIAANGFATAGVSQLAEGFVRKRALEHMADKVKETAQKLSLQPAKPSNARFMPLSVSEAFANARRVDDEERMIDPDLVLG